jgi:hypothetical protein
MTTVATVWTALHRRYGRKIWVWKERKRAGMCVGSVGTDEDTPTQPTQDLSLKSSERAEKHRRYGRYRRWRGRFTVDTVDTDDKFEHEELKMRTEKVLAKSAEGLLYQRYHARIEVHTLGRKLYEMQKSPLVP